MKDTKTRTTSRGELPLFSDKLEVGELEPGINAPKLRQGVNTDGGGNSTAGGGKMLIFTRASSVGNGVQQFTGFGFKPTGYTIQAFANSTVNQGGYSVGGYDGSTEQGVYYEGGYFAPIAYVVRCDNSTNDTRAQHENFITDGIELDFFRSNINIILYITAFR